MGPMCSMASLRPSALQWTSETMPSFIRRSVTDGAGLIPPSPSSTEKELSRREAVRSMRLGRFADGLYALTWSRRGPTIRRVTIGTTWLERARALGPAIAQCRDEAERERRMPRELHDAMLGAGLFGMTLSKTY